MRPFSTAFRTIRGAQPVRAAAAPEGVTLYAVGDVHGRLDLLDALLRHVRSDALVSEGHKILVMLGDYIDRGPRSDQVIARLLAMRADPLLETVCLRGNHEQTLLDFLDDPAIGPAWMRHGGGATLSAYGVEPPARTADLNAWQATAERLAWAIPDSHRRFLQQTSLSYEAGDYLFAHAGVRPGVGWASQTTDDLLSIREPFLSSVRPIPGRVVVFGHTPADAPRLEAGKIGLDTGAYASNLLTGVRLSGTRRLLFQAELDPIRSERTIGLVPA
ncbi:MAG: metallophosphoesterase [Caulobacteraceae bacterium]